MKVIPFEAIHLQLLKDNVRNKQMYVATSTGDLDEWAWIYENKGVAYTGIQDGEIIGFAGCIIPWKGVGDAYLIGTDKIEEHGIGIARTLLRGLRLIEDNMNLHRIQATVHEDFTVSRRWVEWMGFKEEGRMEKFSSSEENYIMYAKVRK
jgi:RimJ/RimL family protein N-acetyltransferase